MLIENDDLITNETTIAEIINNYFTNITKNLNLTPSPSQSQNLTMNEIFDLYNNHPSINKIRHNNLGQQPFLFRPVTTEELWLYKVISELNFKKGALAGCIPAKILKDTCGTYIIATFERNYQ